MTITTSANVKTVLGITDASKDALIALLIPKVEEDFLVIRNKPFDTDIVGEKVGIGDGVIVEFTLSKKPIVKDSENVYVGGSQTSAYTINNTTGKITFTTAPEAAQRVEADYEAQDFYYPEGSELVACRMVGWLIESQKSGGVQSESLGDHSITYEKSQMRNGYPESIVGTIIRFPTFV